MDTRRPLLIARDIAVTLDVDGVRTRVLDGVDLELDAGEVVDVVGPSGSGKSTLLRALAELLPGAAGSLSLADGSTPTSLGGSRWRARVALLPQKPAVVPGTVSANLAVPWRLKVRKAEGAAPSDARMRAELDAVGLGGVKLDRDVSKLSVGQLARLAFARTLLTDPTVLLLDEADAALDADSAERVGARVAAFVSSAEGERAVVRVRHRDDDGIAGRRLRLEDGALTEVAR